MICKLQVVTLGEDGHQETREIACLERTDLKQETLVLTLAEGKMILKDLQQIVVESQVASFLLPKRPCPECGQPRCSKGHHMLSIRTAFGHDERFCLIEGCQNRWDQLPAPDGPLTVGIDGGYVRGQHKQGPFEVIAGKSLLAFKRDQEGEPELSTRCFAWVQTYDEKPKRRLFELLQSQGMQPNQQVEFLSDGGENVRNVQLYLNPQAERLLDWFDDALDGLDPDGPGLTGAGR